LQKYPSKISKPSTRDIPSIVHERERPIIPKGPKISEVLLHNGEEKMMRK
jgi:hypothetical protein